MTEYLKLNRIDNGYYDPLTGNKLSCIDGLQNRPGVDPFKHIGWKLHPICNDGRVLFKAIKENTFILELDIIEAEAIDLESSGAEFGIERLTEDEAKALLENVFGIVIPSE